MFLLIGENCYPQYRHVTTIVMAAHVIRMLLGKLTALEAVGGQIGKTFCALLAGSGAVALIFAVLERKGVTVGCPAQRLALYSASVISPSKPGSAQPAF